MILRAFILSFCLLTILSTEHTLSAQDATQADIPKVNFYYPKNAYRFKVSNEIQGYLTTLKAYMANNDNATIKLDGFAQDGSNDEWNTRVSKYRVRALRDLLIDSGIAKGRIEIEYFGKSDPISKDETANELAKNRRVELRLVEAS